MPDAQLEMFQSAAVDALGKAESVLRAAELSDHEEDGWSADFAAMLVDGMGACLWFVRMGFKPPSSFASWLIRITSDRISLSSSHGDLNDAVDEAAGAVSDLEREWDRRLAQRTGG